MGQFKQELDEINSMVDEIETDLDKTTARMETCLERLDALAGKLAKTSKQLREQAFLHQVQSISGSASESRRPS
jgi:peptidoglycan hydrolase CwlO-like protein